MKKASYVKKTLSALLCLCLVAGLMPAALAELCPHHPSHDGCGFAEARPGTPCTHVCAEDCAEGCIHSHDGLCGYSGGIPAVPCGFVCAECSGLQNGGEPEGIPGSNPEGTPGGDTEGNPGGEAPSITPDDDLPDAPAEDAPSGLVQPYVEGVMITREQFDISRFSIDDGGNLIYGFTSIAPQAVDPISGSPVSGKFSWGGGSAPLVIMNDVGEASYPLYFVPDDSASYSSVTLALVVATAPYVSKTAALSSRLPMGALAAMRATSPTSCTVAVISDSDTLYMEGMLNKFKTSLKPLSGQELERILADNSVTGRIIIDATHSGLRVDKIQLYSFTLRTFMDAIRKGDSGLESIVIKLSGGEVELDLKALESLCINDGCSSVELVINRDAGPGSFNQTQKDVLKQHNVRLISRVYFDCNRREEPQASYGEGHVRIGIPFYYGDIKLCTISEDGVLTELEKSFENGMLSWTISEGCDFILIK